MNTEPNATSTTPVDTAPLELAKSLGLSRRQMLAAATGVAAGVALIPGAAHASSAAPKPAPGSDALAAAQAKGNPRVVVPPARRGIILYSVRDAIGRDPSTTSLPSGFQAVFAELSRIGYSQVEFAGYRQSLNAPGGDTNTLDGARLMRRWLDDNGLRAQGSHGFVPSTLSATDLAAFDVACETANILGMKHIGTGSDPTRSDQKKDWDEAIDRWNFLGRRATRHGLKLYTHNHDQAYDFLMDSGPADEAGLLTHSSGTRRLEYFIERTDPRHVHFEMDIFWAHVAKFKHAEYLAADGSTVTSVLDPLAVIQKQPKRFPMFHAKDGDYLPDTENGYEMTPLGLGDIDYDGFLSSTGAPRWYANPMWEQDTAPSTEDLGQSLRYAEISYDYMASMRS